MPVARYVRLCRRSFDLIYLDPPFRMPEKPGVLEEIGRLGLLDPAGTLIIHVPREEDLGPISGFYLSDTRYYGRSTLHFFRGSRLR